LRNDFLVDNFEPGQIVTVFRSRLEPAHEDEHAALDPEIRSLATSMPGFVDVKSFVAEDGERATIVTFADEESHRAWRDHPVHRHAQALGRNRFYAEYTTQVCLTLSVGNHSVGNHGEEL
jgi:heme-degrading monooxygenase HmoA